MLFTLVITLESVWGSVSVLCSTVDFLPTWESHVSMKAQYFHNDSQQMCYLRARAHTHTHTRTVIHMSV